ncbi:hypothetical protein G2W53_035931 [Senna tora]|uniref:Uncharacterized protein n=1 Tax=Senna tora TaxID=362788 RepID=A0A834STL1_9FABA|nr:hypothetical protein G2W53_035931 [Senna tora]
MRREYEVATSDFFFHSIAFFLITFPFSPSIISLTCASTSSLFTFPSTSNPTPHALHAYLQFTCCSAKYGQHIIGTPPHIPSSVEFHPLCVRNAPTAACERTLSCGHHPTTIPLSFVSSKNSSGRTAELPITTSDRKIQRNGWPLLANPHANSEGEGPHGVEAVAVAVFEVGGNGVQNLGFEVVEGVEDDCVGFEIVLSFLEPAVKRDVVWVGAADKTWHVFYTHVGHSRGSPELNLGNAEFTRHLNSKAHDAIRHDAAHRRDAGGGVEARDEILERLHGVLLRVVQELRDTLGGVRVGGRDAIRDGLEPEPLEVPDGVGALGAEEAAVVEFGVDEGYEEAT